MMEGDIGSVQGMNRVAQAATIKDHRLSSLSNRTLFLVVLETEKSKVKIPSNLLSSEGSLPGL